MSLASRKSSIRRGSRDRLTRTPPISPGGPRRSRARARIDWWRRSRRFGSAVRALDRQSGLSQHFQRQLALADDRVRGAQAREMLLLGIGMRAGNDRQRRIGGAGLLDNRARLERVGHGDEQAA